jgi:hypothetical protein
MDFYIVYNYGLTGGVFGLSFGRFSSIIDAIPFETTFKQPLRHSIDYNIVYYSIGITLRFYDNYFSLFQL